MSVVATSTVDDISYKFAASFSRVYVVRFAVENELLGNRTSWSQNSSCPIGDFYATIGERAGLSHAAFDVMAMLLKFSHVQLIWRTGGNEDIRLMPGDQNPLSSLGLKQGSVNKIFIRESEELGAPPLVSLHFSVFSRSQAPQAPVAVPVNNADCGDARGAVMDAIKSTLPCAIFILLHLACVFRVQSSVPVHDLMP